MTTYLDLDATQAASLARGERVERWVRMEPQPAPDVTSAGVMMTNDEHDGEWSWLTGDPKDAETWMISGDPFRPPHPPGTRARVNTGAPTQAGGVTVRVGAIIIAVCNSVNPAFRDGAWGFVEGWEKC